MKGVIEEKLQNSNLKLSNKQFNKKEKIAMNEIFETTEPTVEDKKYDAFIKGIIKNTSRNFTRQLSDLLAHEEQLSEKIEEEYLDIIAEDEYSIETEPPKHIHENNREYIINDAELYIAIQALSSKERKTILLSAYNSLTDREISETLGIPRRTIADRRAKAMRKLRALMLRRRKHTDE